MNASKVELDDFDVLAFLRGGSGGVVRYGDGEWNAVFAKKGRNADRCSYELANRWLSMLLTVPNPGLTFTMQPHAMRVMGGTIRRWLDRWAVPRLREPRRWPNADFMVRLAREDRIHEFTALLRERDVVLVGPPHLRGLGIPHREFVEVKPRDADPVDILEDLPPIRESTVYLVSAGFAAKVVVAELARVGAVAIDTGSVWDPFAGRGSRGIWKHMLAKGKLPRLA